jgi:prophage DNA circulation protein
LMDLLDVQVAAAADAGNFDLFRAWRAIEAATIADMRERAQSLPTLASFTFPSALPALVVAQQLLQDATQADALVQLNNTPHPLFMAPAGFWLQPA